MRKTPKQLERYCKGLANHWRISILLTVQKHHGATLEGISSTLGGDVKNISQHTHRLVHAGLLRKKYVGRQVAHTLSPYGNNFLRFLQKF